MTRAAYIHFAAEFAPILIFFIVGQFLAFELAALILVITTVLAVIISLLSNGQWPGLPIVSAVFVVISGLITYFFNEPDVLIIADSIYYLCIAAAIGFGLSRKHYLLKKLFSSTFAMTDDGWRILCWRWFFMFLLAGIGNEIARLILTPEMWVDYRFATIIIIGIFACYQFTLSAKYRIPEVSNNWGLRIQN